MNQREAKRPVLVSWSRQGIALPLTQKGVFNFWV